MATNTKTIDQLAIVTSPAGKNFVVEQGGVANRLPFSNLQNEINNNSAVKFLARAPVIASSQYTTGQDLLDALLAWKQGLSNTSAIASMGVIGNRNKIMDAGNYLTQAVNDNSDSLTFTALGLNNSSYFTLLAIPAGRAEAALFGYLNGTWTVKKLTLA